MASKTTVPAPGFFKSIPASIYSPEFYAGIPQRSFWKGFWYLVGFTFIMMILWAAYFVAVPYMTHRDEINQTVDRIVHFYPEELVITIQDGKASTNVDEPYMLKFGDIFPTENWNQTFKEGFEEGLAQEGEFGDLDDFNLAVIDTKTPFSMEQFREYQTLVWLTEDALYVISENQGAEGIPLEGDNIVITKQLVDEGMETILVQVKSVIPVLAVFMLIFAFILVVIGRMLYLLLFSLFLFIAYSIMNLPYDYGAAYKMGIYAITLPTLVSMALFMTQPFTGFGGFPFLFTILGLLIAVINLDKAKKMGLIKEKKA